MFVMKLCFKPICKILHKHRPDCGDVWRRNEHKLDPVHCVVSHTLLPECTSETVGSTGSLNERKCTVTCRENIKVLIVKFAIS